MRAPAVFYELLLGFALLVAPWSRVWRENWLFWNAGVLGPWLLSGPVKGAVSGFGAAFLLRVVGELLRVPLVDEPSFESGSITEGVSPSCPERPATPARR